MIALIRRFVVITAGLVALQIRGAETTSVAPPSTTPVPPPVAGFPIGWCTRVLPSALDDAKTSAFEYIELALQDVLKLGDEEFAAMAARLRALPMPALTGYNPIPAELPLVGPGVEVEKQNAHLAHLLDRASALKLRMIILNSGRNWSVPEGFARDAAFAQLAEFCSRFATQAAARGIDVLIQPQRSRDTNMITTIAEALAVVEKVKLPNFHLMVDYSFLTIQGDDPKALLASGDHLRHVHIANPAANRTYPFTREESDYAAFFAVLKQIRFRGGISVHGGTTSFATDAPRAIAFLRTLAAELATTPDTKRAP